MSRLEKLAVITALIGLGSIGIVILSDTSYPNLLFTYGTAIGLLMVVVSILLYAAGWSQELFENVKEKNIIGVVILLAAAILFLVPFMKSFLN